jgi:PAS domain-containing protein
MGHPAISWAELAASGPDGLAVVDADGRFVQLNQAAAAVFRRDVAELAGATAPFGIIPFEIMTGSRGDPAERVTSWSPAPGIRREFAYRAQRLPPTRR